MNNLNEKCMLASLVCRFPSFQRKDKLATDSIKAQFNATNYSSSDIGRFTKQLIDPKLLKDGKNIVMTARKEHWDMTIAWDETGTRLLPTLLYQDYRDAMNKHQIALNTFVTEFIPEYGKAIQEAKNVLGDLFNQAEYPSPDQLRAKIELKLSFMPLPVINDFRLQLLEADNKAIKEQLEQDLHAINDRVLQAIKEKISDPLQRLEKSLSNPDGKVNSITIENILGLIEMIPKFNLIGHKEVDDILKEIEEFAIPMTDTNQAFIIKNVETEREKKAKKAQELLDKVDSMMF